MMTIACLLIDAFLYFGMLWGKNYKDSLFNLLQGKSLMSSALLQMQMLLTFFVLSNWVIQFP
jgi:hypothetical protein